MRVALPVVLASLGFAASACEFFEPKVSKEKLEAELAAWLKTNELTASDVVCPDNQKLEQGNVFECTCKVGDVDVPVRVEVIDPSEGKVEWKPKYLTVKHETIEAAMRELPELAGRDLDLHCLHTVLVSVPGSEWTCDATDKADGDKPYLATLKFTDGEGTYEWSLAPKPL